MSDLRYIDADVHPMTRKGIVDVLAYVPQGWRKRLSIYRSFEGGSRHPSPVAEGSGGANFAADARPPDGSRPGSDPEYTRAHLLDARNVMYALLLPMEPVYATGITAVDDVVTLNRAYNDYFIDKWLPADSRYRLAISVSPHDPVAAAAEIRRLSGVPGVTAVVLPLLNILMGHRHYYPIYEAAVESGLPIVIHTGPGGADFQGAPTIAGGVASTYFAAHTLQSEIAISSVVSLVLEGVFNRYPTLMILIAELGFTWVPHVMWRLDREWESLHVETPWLDRPPSDYIRKHIRYTTQPLEDPKPKRHLFDLIDMIHGHEVLLFSSDYPHWDNEYPDTTLQAFPADLRARVLRDNALDLFPNLKAQS